MNEKTSKLVKISLLSAIAIILRYIEFPIIPAFTWLQFDFSDVPAMLGAFGFGPIAGIIIELLKNVLILVIKGTGTGFVGELANFLMGSALVVPAGLLYYRKKNKKNAIIGMILGAVCIQIVGILSNIYILLPAYHMTMDNTMLMNYITFGLLPINGIKAVATSVVTYILYKKLSVAIFKAESNFGSPERTTN
ncbi:ECF transporter S component [Clostridium saccharoperbutylacetonicum]|uniref:ECF transporter S component n=1 Tax=Clostridium saccharoperbutylacetonicum TaxID=36745 RepID=UPI000983FCA1|nr:ECF transporter S component [Clostridium saccharoperbutylacetonicum]AQR93463.1 riboflavin transporter RibU [Clostridium saccharoperbutylacetonicum]NSB29161.1 ECF transporter S component (folate family) [Clostridium saccharoperbutylacetonicum]